VEGEPLGFDWPRLARRFRDLRATGDSQSRISGLAQI
jgi:hypothetical protein